MNDQLTHPRPAVLPFFTARGLITGALLLTAAYVIPALAHLVGAPVLWLLPMHWPVILAGLLYGWRGGLTIGALAPLVAFALSGMPAGLHLPLMIAELAAYGFLAGLLREVPRLNGHAAAGIAVAGGRLLYAALAALFVTTPGGYWNYLGVALLPGLPAAAAMIALLPLLARRLAAGDPTGD
jgi:hypothetical protein